MVQNHWLFIFVMQATSSWTWKLYCFSFTASWTCLPAKHGWVILLCPRDIALSTWWCPKTDELLYMV